MPRIAILVLAALLTAPGRAASAQAPVAGVVLGRDGTPAQGVTVRLIGPRHPELPGRIARRLGAEAWLESTAMTDEAGRFRVVPTGRGPFAIHAAAGPETLSGMRFPVSPGDYCRLTLAELRPATVRLVVKPDPDGHSKPVAHHPVEARIVPDGFGWAADLPWPSIRLRQRTDASGRCRFWIPRRRLYCVRARLGTLRAVSWPVGWDQDQTTLWLAGQDEITGTLVDAGTGAPIAGALVHDVLRPELRTRSDAAGAFRLRAHPVSFLQVVAAHHARAVIGPAQRLDGGGPPRVELRRGHRLSARLLDAGGSPLAAARVLFAGACSSTDDRGAGEVAIWEDRTGPDGRVRAGWLDADRPIAGFVEVGGRFVWFLCGAPAADLDLGDVAVGATASLAGRVAGPDRAPLAGARICLQPRMSTRDVGALRNAPAGFFSRIAVTDRGGRFAFDGLLVGDYDLAVDAPGWGRCFAHAHAAPGAPALRLALQGGSLRGTVEDGAPVAGARVTVRPCRVPADWQLSAWQFGLLELEATTDEQGRFRFCGLPPASCTVEVRRWPSAIWPDTAMGAVRPGSGPLRLRLEP